MTPEQAGISSKYIKQYIEKLEERQLPMHNLLIAKGDDIIFETYWAPFHENFYHRMYSVSKSVVALAIGFLEQEGKISLDDPIGKYFPDEITLSNDTNLKRQTIRHMLMMSTARLPKGDAHWFKLKPADRVRYYFEDSERTSRPSGTIWEYDSTGSFILCALVERLSGQMFVEYLRERLFDKIGVSGDLYCLQCPGGHSWGDSGILCTQRDLFKIARFVMNKGKWNDEQILNEAYITAAISKQIDNAVSGVNAWDCFGYGYQIWRTYQNSYLFYGMGSQLALCIPDKDLIMICNGDTQGNPYDIQLVVEEFFNYVANHVEERNVSSDEICKNSCSYEDLCAYTKNLKLMAVKGESFSPLEHEIHGIIWKMDENPMGITKMRFAFDADGGTWFYTNAQGDKELRFGRCENAFCKFPQDGYANMIGTISEPGYRYDCAASGAWLSPDKLFLKIQIIDKYFGNLNVSIGFQKDRIGVYMQKTAEDFLEEYQGFATGVK